ncbi:MAG: ligase [Chloroflexota bacterium]
MAAGEVLLEGAARDAPALHWYGITPDAVVLGPRQHDTGALDGAACREQGLGVYVRRSGGTAVLADRFLLNLDVALPRDHQLLPPDVTRAYAWLGTALATGLRLLGVPASALATAEVRAEADLRGGGFAAARAACFGGLSPYEAVADGRKIVGLAQVRRREGALLQAGVPVRWDPERLASVLAGTPLWRASLAGELLASAAGLDRWGLTPADRPRIVEVLTTAILGAAGVRGLERPWSPDERAAIGARATLRYPAL